MFWLILAIVVVIYILAMFRALPEQPAFTQINIWKPRHPTLLVLAVVIGIIGFYVRYLFPDPTVIDNWLLGFLLDLAPEMVGMAFTVVVIDELNQIRIEQQHKREIIEELRSPVRDVAVEALRLVRKNGWWEEVVAQVDLTKVQWEGADLQGANLEGVDLYTANLAQADLMNSKLGGARFWGANLTEAKLTGANLAKVRFAGADLTGAYLFRANLEGVDLWGATLTGARLREANLARTNLSGASLEKAHLWYTDLTEADLRNVDLTEAQLNHANLSGTYLQRTNLQGAKYTTDTIWPEGFDPIAAGAILVDDND